MLKFCAPLLLVLAGCALPHADAPLKAPLADHHQHVLSPVVAAMIAGPGIPAQLTAGDVIVLLDKAGIERAMLLSVAYMYGRPERNVPDEYAKVRAENDWTAAQAALYPTRLRAFCSFNPLKPYALEELHRCAASPGLRNGLKFHFGNSDIQLDKPEHLARMREVFQLANAKRMPIVMHLRASISKKRPYGAATARLFLEQLVPLATDIPLQVAHLAGAGPGYDDPPSDEVMATLAQAVQRREPGTQQLWFDVASMVAPDITPAQAALVAQRIRQVGTARILYGTDSALGDNIRPAQSWAAFRRLPLTEQEFDAIARNVAPYAR